MLESRGVCWTRLEGRMVECSWGLRGCAGLTRTDPSSPGCTTSASSGARAARSQQNPRLEKIPVLHVSVSSVPQSASAIRRGPDAPYGSTAVDLFVHTNTPVGTHHLPHETFDLATCRVSLMLDHPTTAAPQSAKVALLVRTQSLTWPIL